MSDNQPPGGEEPKPPKRTVRATRRRPAQPSGAGSRERADAPQREQSDQPAARRRSNLTRSSRRNSRLGRLRNNPLGKRHSNRMFSSQAEQCRRDRLSHSPRAAAAAECAT